MYRASKNERKVKKEKVNRRKEGKEKDKDIHLNVVGVPTTNVNVNKTAQRQQEKHYHLYKISIDTTRRERERQRKRHVSTTKPSQVQAKDNRARPSITRSDTSSTESEFYRLSPSRRTAVAASQSEPKKQFSTKEAAVSGEQNETIPLQKLTGKMGRSIDKPSAIAVKRHKSNESNPDVCFTTSDENKRKIRIVGSKKQRSHESSKKTKSSFSNNSSPRKQVGFAGLDAVYGTTPEESSRESDYDLPYKKHSPQVYQIQNMVPQDAFYNESTKFNTLPDSSESPKTDALTRKQLRRESDLPLEEPWPHKEVSSTISREQHKVLNVTDIPIERSIMTPKADRKHLTNEQSRMMPFEQIPIFEKEPWDEASSPLFERDNSIPNSPLKPIQIEPGNTRGMAPSSERPSSIFNKSNKRAMSPEIEERGEPFKLSATHQYIPEISKIDQTPAIVDQYTSSKPQTFQEGINPTINYIKPTMFREIVQVPSKSYTGLDPHIQMEKNIPYQTSLPTEQQATSSKSQEVSNKTPDDSIDNEEYLLTKPYNIKNDSLNEKLNAHEYPRLQHINTSKLFQEPSISVSSYQNSNRYVISASEKGTDTSDLYGPINKPKIGEKVLPPVRSPHIMYETTSNLKAINALPVKDRSTTLQFDALKPSITRNKEDETNRTPESDSYRSDKRPLTVDRELMTEILPDTIKDNVSSTSKTRSKLLHLKRPSKESSKYRVDREKTSIRKFQNSSLVSTIPKPSFRDRKSSILTEKHHQTESELRTTDEPFKVKTKPLYLQKPPTKHEKSEVGLKTSLPLESAPSIKSGIIPGNKMHGSNFKYNEFPIWSDSFSQNKPTMAPHSDLADLVPGKSVHLSTFHTHKESSLPIKSSNDTSIEISHRTYGDRSSVETTESNVRDTRPIHESLLNADMYKRYESQRPPPKNKKSSSHISSKVSHDRSVNELITSSVLDGVSRERMPSNFESVHVGGSYAAVAPVNEIFDTDTVNKVKEGRTPSYYNKLNSFLGKFGQKQNTQMSSNYFQADQSKGSLRGEASNQREEPLRQSIISVPVIETIQEEDTGEETGPPFPSENMKLSHSTKRTIGSDNISRNMKNKNAAGRAIMHQPSDTQEFDQGSSEYLKEPYKSEKFDQTFNKPEILAYRGDIVDQNPFGHDRYSTDGPFQEDEGLDDLRDTQPIHESLLNADMYKRYEARRPPSRNENVYMDTNPDLFELPIQQSDVVRRDETLPEGYSISSIKYPRSISNTYKPLHGSYTEKSFQVPNGITSGSKINDKKHPSSIKAEKRRISTLETIKRDNVDTNISRGIKKTNKENASTEQTNIFGRSPAVEAVYVGRIPNTTLNVFFSPDAGNTQTTNRINEDNVSETSRQLQQVKSTKLISEGPKGILIFVNKKTDPGKDPFEEPRRLTGSGTPPDSDKRKSSSGRRSSPVRGSVSPKSSRKPHKIVEKSPSESKITEKYPCGCVRIITKDPNGELAAEELISAFCQDGSKCEVRHPRLQKSHRLLSLDETSKKSSLAREDVRKYSSEKRQLPEIEVIATGVVSKKPIKPKTPSPTMKGANYTGTLNIKGDKFNGTCNFYIDERLKDYIRNNLDVIKEFLDTKHEPRQLMQ